MSQQLISQTAKNFLTQFEQDVIPHLNKTTSLGGVRSIVCYVSSATLLDPQLKELLGIKPGLPTGRFMGVTVKGKPDMTVEVFGTENEQ